MTIQEQLSKLTIEQKAKLCVGMNFWMTQNYPEANIPSLFLSDGPHGLRKQEVGSADHLGINESHKSVCYPPACTAACSWDRDLIEEMGRTLGREAHDIGVDILLGPGINIKRSPLCGRNFEYYSEDPYLAGEMAAALVKGVQASPVSACVKHFAANSQENRRKAINAIMDERTLREIYLTAFEIAVKKGNVHSVMTAYNKINGKYMAENTHIATDILRKDWGFDGILMTDWGAMDQIVPSIKAGLSLQMPGDDGSSVKKILAAIENHSLSEDNLDKAVIGILNVINALQTKAVLDHVSPEECHAMAVKVAQNSIVLLKNDRNILPLCSTDKVAVIGEMAVIPRYQGAGSSHVNPYRVTCALDELRKESVRISYAQGYHLSETSDDLIRDAVKLAAACEKVVLFIGLPDSYESETYDRTTIEMPEAYNRLVEEVLKVNTNLVVVLSNGSVVALPWKDDVPGIVEAYLGGEGSGEAISDVLFGKVNPSGKLAESFIRKIEDAPTAIGATDSTDISDICEYREGVFVGYRYYEKKKIEPNFCFGHGLSYTAFEYSEPRLSKHEITDRDCVQVSVKVRNTGERFGQEVVQIYVGRNTDPVPAPVKELRNFKKISLQPGEEKEVVISLGKRDFAYFNEQIQDWYVPESQYTVYIGSSSGDIRQTSTLTVRPSKSWRPKATRNTVLKDILDYPEWFQIFAEKYEEIKPHLPFGLSKLDINTDPFARGLLNNMTLHSLESYVGAALSDEDIESLLVRMNALI